MLENLSSTQKAVGGVVVIAGVVGWIFAFVQIGEVDSLKSELEPARQGLASAKDELAQLQGDLEAAQSERSQLEQRVETTESLEALAAALEAGNAKLLALQSEIEGSQAELETLRPKVQKQQALLEGSMLRFKTKARARVRAGPGTDTDEVAVVPAGKTLQVFEIVEDGSWYKVGGMGYVFHELLEPVEKKLAE
jgi:DNA repair exonuclease SbcCD ATPase subunit